MTEPAPRIVLDTNVCLDLLLFRNAECAALAAALAAGQVQAVARAAMRAEWRRVLGYATVPAAPETHAALLAAWDALLARWPEADPPLPALPLCRDPDDQMFITLAAASGARWLLSKDKALLKLDRRASRVAGFRILHPRDWRLD